MNFPVQSLSFSVFKYTNYLLLCQKSEKTDMPFLTKMLNSRMDGKTYRRTDIQLWLCRTLCRMGPIIKVTLSFPEFISKHQKPVYSINFSARYSQFEISATRVGTLIYDYAHSKTSHSTFNSNEFVSTCKISDFFIILFYRQSWFKIPAIWLAKNCLVHISGTNIF